MYSIKNVDENKADYCAFYQIFNTGCSRIINYVRLEMVQDPDVADLEVIFMIAQMAFDWAISAKAWLLPNFLYTHVIYDSLLVPYTSDSTCHQWFLHTLGILLLLAKFYILSGVTT